MLLPILALAGLLSLPLWPAEWRVGLAMGWILAMAMEYLVDRRRTQLLRSDARSSRGKLMQVSAFSFLAKLFLLAVGGIVGQMAELYHAPSFMLSFLAAAFLGEAYSLMGVARATRSTPSAESLEDAY